MFENKPLVSVIVPVYNAEAYLEQCVNSLIYQTYENIQIVLVNDGSTDSSFSICESFKLKDKRVEIITKINEGPSSARNSGIYNSKGMYIVFLDADDWLEPDTIETSAYEMTCGDYDMIIWQMIKEYHNESVKFIGPFRNNIIFKGDLLIDLYRRTFGPTGIQLEKPQLIDSFLAPWGKLYRTDIIKNNNLNFIDTKIVGSEDVLLNIQYFYHCRKVKYIHKYFNHYRKTNLCSVTKTHGSTLFNRFIKLFEKINEEIVNKKLDDGFKLALSNRIAISIMNVGLAEVSPRNSISNLDKIINIKTYLSNPLYVEAYSKLNFSYFPIHWKIFFIFCKRRIILGVFILLKIMSYLIKK